MLLSGDDPMTVAVMAIGGRGVISVASNEAPAEMVQIVELCEKGDFAGARKLHHWLLPLIQVNFVESNPIPCKAAMAAMGLLEESYRLPLVPPTAATREKVIARAPAAEAARRRRARLIARPHASSPIAIPQLVRAGRVPRPKETRARGVPARCATSCRPDACARPSPTPTSPTGWRVNVWVKQGILLGFRFGDIVDMGVGKGRWPFFDKDTHAAQAARRCRAAFASSPADRRSARAPISAPGVICMPPMYINVGAYVGDGTLVDSHALVGSCAQIGKRVHLSAAAQIGGVIEPVGAMPVIVEDDVLVGGNCGVYEGAIVKTARGARLRDDHHRVDAGLRPAERAHHQARAGPAAGRCPKARSSCRARAR